MGDDVAGGHRIDVSTTNSIGAPINGWVYFLGEKNGEDIKIGSSTGETMRKRLRQVDAEQTTTASYKLLAAVRGDGKDEAAAKRYFAALKRDDKGRKQEYFQPDDVLAEYVNWLRQWWWCVIDPDEPLREVAAVDPEGWLPSLVRRLPHPEPDTGLLIQSYQDLSGYLAGTPWDWMLSPKQSVQDYFTPPELVAAARTAMGDIDLDAASHPLANREHRIGDYFHINRSAFDNEWHGRVWLNPPYGNNAPWFERLLHFWQAGTVSQLCMLSPVWVFTAEQARPVMQASAAAVLLSPTPRFWGHAEHRTGSNHPHAVIYLGGRVTEFLAAFAPFGIPVEFPWARVSPQEGIAA